MIYFIDTTSPSYAAIGAIWKIQKRQAKASDETKLTIVQDFLDAYEAIYGTSALPAPPMLELLAEKKHVSFIDTPLYVYRLHSGNVHNHDKKSQSDDLNYLRFQMKKYEPLDRKVLKNHLFRSQCVASLVS